MAPLKELTIPRLELQAAVLASRLCKTIGNEIRIPLQESILFTDSEIVLAWIRNQGRRLKPFVSSRVGEIQSKIQPAQWKHIPSAHRVQKDGSSRSCNNGNYNVRNRLRKVFKLEKICTSYSLGPKDEKEVTEDTREKQNCRKRTVDTART